MCCKDLWRSKDSDAKGRGHSCHLICPKRSEQHEVSWTLFFLIPAYTELLTAIEVSCAQRCDIRAWVQEEEAARKAEEEEGQLAAEREQRKADRAARRAEAKRQGLLLTGKAKKEAERLAALREQLLAKAGVEIASAPSGEAQPVCKNIRYQALQMVWSRLQRFTGKAKELERLAAPREQLLANVGIDVPGASACNPSLPLCLGM